MLPTSLPEEMTQEFQEWELKALSFLKGSSGIDIEMLHSSLGVTKGALAKCISLFIGNGLAKYRNNTKRNIEITRRGRFFLEKGDPRIALGYPQGSTVPDYVAFRFALGEGILTGDTAHSYQEFLSLVGRIDSRSLVFHLYRGDFDAWFDEVFRDKRISGRIARLKMIQQSPDKIRSKLVSLLTERIGEISKQKEKR